MRAAILALPLLLLSFAGAALADASFKLDGHQLVVPTPVVFETAGDRLKPESDAALALVKQYLEAKQAITLLRIEVHTDNAGDANKNQALSERRALSVARALVGNGVDCKRLLPVGFGASKPIAPSNTPEGRAQNRRTAFFNAALRGRPIGGLPVDGGGKVAGDPCR